MKSVKKSLTIAGKELMLEYGRFAEQADCAVLAQYGETMVLSSVVSSAPREDINYFPLFVEYIERLYAGGKIKGSRWVKREGRPSDEAIQKARLIDRSIRPLFPEEYRNETQVAVTLLSVDGENDPDILSIIATSAALSASQIPWKGPVGAVRVGSVENENIINPTLQETALSDLDLIVSAVRDRVLMLEGSGNELPEDSFISAITDGQEEINRIIEFIEEFAGEVGPTKIKIAKDDASELLVRIKKEYTKEINELTDAYITLDRKGEKQLKDELTEEVYQRLNADYSKQKISDALDKLRKKTIRRRILEKGERLDGRKPNELREIKSEVDVLPRTHGSAVFERGSTQALTVTTLGSPGLEQWLESPSGEETKRYMHHYYMPPYSVGETGRFGWPSRREVGHGALAERALVPVIPPETEFSYTIRVVSEILSSNGSTSMASVCGSSLSLMDAGVPIKAPVAGISVGLVTGDSEDEYVLLKDIMGVEDFNGDMDFKLAGTEKGVTAVQLDVKIRGLTQEIIREAVSVAREARMEILEKMSNCLPEARDHVSKYAPKVERFRIPEDKIGAVIGPGGSMIRQIIANYTVEIDVDDDEENEEGVVTVSGLEKENVDKAIDYIKGLTREFKPGEEFTGTVKRVVPFGAFVEIFPGREGLVHISKMARRYVEDPNNIVSEGDEVKVKIREIDEQDRINLTMILDEDSGGSRRDGGRGGNRGGGGRRGGSGRRNRNSSRNRSNRPSSRSNY